MVNFEADTIVQVSPRQTITYIYLQRSEELQSAWNDYYRIKFQNKNTVQAVAEIRAATMALFSRLNPSLRKSLSAEDYAKVEALMKSDKIDDLEKAEQELENYLYVKNITRIDSTKNYNPAMIEEENKAHGL